MEGDRDISKILDLIPEATCVLCGERLVDLGRNAIVRSGIGIVCGSHVLRQAIGPSGWKTAKDHFCDRWLPLDLSEGIVLERGYNGISTNVPHYLVVHDANGYEWGSWSPGTLDLALNIVEAILRDAGYAGERRDIPDASRQPAFLASWELYAGVAGAFLVDAPSQFTIPYVNVAGWIMQHANDHAGEIE